jgi:hypothetical protein
VAEAEARDAIALNADARLYIGLFDDGDNGTESAELALSPGRKAYVHIATGEATVNGQALQTGDALAMDGEMLVTISAGRNAQVLVFDLAP